MSLSGPDWCSRAIPRIRTPRILLRWVCFERAIGPALADHLLTVGIEGIIDDPLGGVQLVVVPVAQVPEALGNRLQPLSFRLVPERIICIGAIHNFTEQNQG